MNTDNRRKVLLLSPFGNAVGGIARWACNVMDYYQNQNSQDLVLDILPMNRIRRTSKETFIVLRVIKSISDYLEIFSLFRKKLQNDHPDIVHITSSASLGLFRDLVLIKMAKLANAKTIIHFHFGRVPQIFSSNKWEKYLIKNVIRKVDSVIIIDRPSYDTLLTNGYKHLYLIPNPLSSEAQSIIDSNKIERIPGKILFAGHIIITKGVYELIDACKCIKNIRLKFIGLVTDEMRKNMENRGGKNSSSWMEIAGNLSFEDTMKEMLSAGLFVLPSYTEGFPNVIIESMACGCPIIATNVGAIPEILEINSSSSCGICIEPRDAEQLKEAINKMLSDSKFSENCAINANKRVKSNYSMPIIWKQLMALYENIMRIAS